MTIHKCYKCEKTYDCDNEAVDKANRDFYLRLLGFNNEEELAEAGKKLETKVCTEGYMSTCRYCAYKVIFGVDYGT